jgi:hypothetical protein
MLFSKIETCLERPENLLISSLMFVSTFFSFSIVVTNFFSLLLTNFFWICVSLASEPFVFLYSWYFRLLIITQAAARVFLTYSVYMKLLLRSFARYCCVSSSSMDSKVKTIIENTNPPHIAQVIPMTLPKIVLG